MNEVAFNKAIKKLILPKYPWIIDYDLVVEIEDDTDLGRDSRNYEYYGVDYYISDEWTPIKADEVKELTGLLFKALGFDEHQKFDGSWFYKESENGEWRKYS
jgi:hypothetical protein